MAMAFRPLLTVLFIVSPLLFTAKAQDPEAVISRTQPPVGTQVAEGSDYDVCIILTATPASQVVVNVATVDSNAIAGRDYTSVDMDLTFTSTNEQCVTVSILEDNAVEALEFFTVSVTSSDVSVRVDSVSRLPLIMDTTVPNVEFAQSSYTIRENDTGSVCVMPITTFEGAQQFSIDVSAIEGTAIENMDFTLISGPRPFPSENAMGLCFSPGIIDDDIAEDQESYTLSFTSASVNGSTTIFIQDDDGVTVTFAQTDFTVDEDDAGMSSSRNVCLTITPPAEGLARNAVVTLSTVENTAADTADFVPLNEQLTFTDSMTMQCRTVDIVGDVLVEGEESFYVVGTPQYEQDMFVGPNQVSFTILESDECPSLNNPENGVVEVTTRNLGSTASYSCIEGFDLSEELEEENGRITCEANGWMPALEDPICNSAASFVLSGVLLMIILMAAIVVV